MTKLAHPIVAPSLHVRPLLAAGCALILCSTLLKSRAEAHGSAASVLGVVGSDAEGRPELLRLSEGLAILTGGEFRYLCPALFDSEDTPRAAALPAGPTLVATAEALFVLQDDGQVTPHPDPTARSGTIRALDASADGVFALRGSDAGAELIRLDARAVQVLASVPTELASLAIEDGGLLMAGLTRDGRALQRGFHPDGRARAEWDAEAPVVPDAVAALARLAASQPYVLVLAGDGPVSELVRLDGDGQSEVVQRASVVLSGPIATDPEHVSLAFDGQLAELSEASVTPRASDAPVTCLSRAGGFSYACMSTEVVALRDGAPAERVFGLDQLQAPELAQLEPALAERCMLQWLRFRVDLIGAGIELQEADAGSTSDAGGAAAARDAGAERAESRDGCSVRGASAATAGIRGTAWWLALAACAWWRSRRAGRVDA